MRARKGDVYDVIRGVPQNLSRGAIAGQRRRYRPTRRGFLVACGPQTPAGLMLDRRSRCNRTASHDTVYGAAIF